MSPTSCQTAPPRDRSAYMTQRGETIALFLKGCQTL